MLHRTTKSHVEHTATPHVVYYAVSRYHIDAPHNETD